VILSRQRLGLLAEQPHTLEMVPRSLKIKVYPIRPTAEVTKELMPKRTLLSQVSAGTEQSDTAVSMSASGTCHAC
jgi:hypothetical protein